MYNSGACVLKYKCTGFLRILLKNQQISKNMTIWTDIKFTTLKKYGSIWKKIQLFSRFVTKPTMRGGWACLSKFQFFLSNLQYNIQLFFYISQQIIHESSGALTEILDFSYFWGNFELFWANLTFFSQIYPIYLCLFDCSFFFYFSQNIHESWGALILDFSYFSGNFYLFSANLTSISQNYP